MFPLLHFRIKLDFHSAKASARSKNCSQILGGRVNQTDVSNTNNIFTPPSTPVNLEGDQHEQDFNEAVERSLLT